MPKVNKTKYAILGILTLMPATGYDIKKFCDSGISCFWNENFGHIYPVLRKMEEEDLITKKNEEGGGGVTRNVFLITEKGRKELIDWLMKPVEDTPARMELLLKLTFAKNIPSENIVKELENAKLKYSKALNDLKIAEEKLTNNEKTKVDDGYPFWLATLRYGLYDAQFRIKWCEETIGSIKKHKKK